LAIRREQCLCVSGQLIAGEEGNMRIRDSHYAPEQPMGVFLRPLADDKGYYQAPGWSKGHPHPRIAITFAQQLRRQPMGLLGVDNTPQFIQLACGHVEMLPVGQHHQPTLPGGTIQPRADGIFVTLNNPSCRVDGVAFRQRAHCQFKRGYFDL
jgi:hypothetical protein